jgi:hypothetical protein
VELAGRLQQLFPGTSQDTRPSRGPEVVRFRADTGRMTALLGIVPPRDPLANLAAYVSAG